jgi:hypothetical protein
MRSSSHDAIDAAIQSRSLFSSMHSWYLIARK